MRVKQILPAEHGTITFDDLCILVPDILRIGSFMSNIIRPINISKCK